MNLKKLISELRSLRDDLAEKEVVIIAPNGLEFEPQIKFVRKNKYDILNNGKDNIEKLVITYE